MRLTVPPFVRDHARAGLTGLFSLYLLVVCFCQLCFSQAKVNTPVGRDIEEVWERPAKTSSFSSKFTELTGRDDLNLSFAIVIGLSDYTGDWPPLEAPWYDAQHVRDAFKDQGFDYIVTLTNKAATKEKIRHYMEDVFPARVGKNDQFVFYYSGHGTQEQLFNATRGYLPMLDSKTNLWSSMIGMQEIAEWSENIGAARHSLFVLDACFSGLAGEQHKGDPYIKIYMDDLMKPGHFLMTAGSAGQESYASLSKWGGSLFTNAFLKGIDGQADSGTKEFPPDGVISVTKLYQYIRLRISAERASAPSVDQTPLLSDLSPKSEGEFFFFDESSKAHPLLSPPVVAGQPIAAKGYALNDATPIEAPSQKVDRIFSGGLTDFPNWQFGKSLSQLGNYSWDTMPRAGEFKRNDVRYLILNIGDGDPSYKSIGCISPTSYFVFFFESQKLFRISIRFFDEGKCPGHSVWLNHFANSVGASIVRKGAASYFEAQGTKVEMLGASNSNITAVDLVSANSTNLMTSSEWYDWINGSPQ
jgi:hypothetical protein